MMTPSKSSSSLDVDRSALHSPQWSKRGSVLPTPLTRAHVEEALAQSEDHGVTLVFLKKNITDIEASAAEELATTGSKLGDAGSRVERIALGNNHLTTLPMQFAMMSRLRYLNLKGNCFTVFPEVLTLMPSLDTLDLSHNKIKRLPTRPGELLKLKVFCLSRNKITRLPEYISKFQNLSVLELERNPIEWPPSAVMDRPSRFPTPEAMKDWVHALQRWIEKDTSDHEDAVESNFAAWSRFPVSESEFDEGVTPHARSFSIDSNFSVSSSIAESDIETPSSSYGQLDRPPPLHLGILQSESAETSPTRSFESYLPSPADSDSFSINDPTAHSSPSAKGDRSSKEHGRNASYAPSGIKDTQQVDLQAKKSMPDLRTARFAFSSRKAPDLPTLPSLKSKTAPDDFSIPSPLSTRQDSGSSMSSGFRSNRPFSKESAHPSPTRPITSSMAFERNSYFRRLSTLPISTMSDALPRPLLSLIECARSILFAVCQIYQTLEHYTIYAIDDRLSSVLRKLLDPASVDMMQLIHSLDRFDAISRKTLPPPSVCRGVVESCKDTVAVFGKAVSVLSLQIKVIADSDDVRNVRTMILVLYGAAAEISWAWQAMVPHIEAIKPHLRGKPYPIPSPNSISMMGSDPYSPSSASQSPAELSHSLVSLRPSPPGGASERIRVARRHAGSFSSKDVEIGKTLPSYDDVPLPPISRGFSANTFSGHPSSTLRAPKRHATLAPMAVTVSSPSPTSPQHSFTGESSRTVHSRAGSQASSPGSSSSSPTMPSRTPVMDLPSSSKTQVDKEAIQAVQNAMDVAPVVWDMMEDVLGDALEAQKDTRECLDRARSVTTRLTDLVRAMKDGDMTSDKGALRDDAHLFLKTVVQLSNTVKTYNGTRSSALRNNMYKLTNATEEFAILLHVSSFAPTSTPMPRPYSPMLTSASQTSLVGPQDDYRLMSSLSRTRSAQPTGTFKLPYTATSPEPPRSAQPTQSFKVPVIRRLRGRDTRERIDINDPG
ncbi:hypothetical protein BDZ89DRAFT_1126642 [Hymenopellis radicata]|nr:hypothetical protein BDZ89DRAFT_1126642 [Hymenopellis radicata]